MGHNTTEYSQEVMDLYQRLQKDAEAGGYHLNPDKEMTLILVEGLLANQKRYGYMLCPCRLGTGDKERDLDIICPCDYRDPDLDEYGNCYCALYVSQDILEGKEDAKSIPERRLTEEERSATKRSIEEESKEKSLSRTTLPVWRCKVCGYLCAREKPPAVCPICKAERERFELFPL